MVILEWWLDRPISLFFLFLFAIGISLVAWQVCEALKDWVRGK